MITHSLPESSTIPLVFFQPPRFLAEIPPLDHEDQPCTDDSYTLGADRLPCRCDECERNRRENLSLAEQHLAKLNKLFRDGFAVSQFPWITDEEIFHLCVLLEITSIEHYFREASR